MRKTNATLALVCAAAITAQAGAAQAMGACDGLSGPEKESCEETNDLKDAWEDFLKAMED